MINYEATRTYKIGIVGTGNVSRMHLEGMARHRDLVEIHAACDPNEQSLRQRSREFDIAHTYASLNDMLDKTDIDAAVVCTPSHLRKEVLLPLLQAGVPVFCEKPLAETYESAREIADWSRHYQVPVAVNQNFRRFFSFHTAREILRQGALGQPLHITQAVNNVRRDTGWRLERERYIMAVMSNHWFDGYRYLLQDEPATIYCRGLKNQSGQDNAVSVILEFPQGTVVSLTESFNSVTGLNGATLDCEHGGLVMHYDRLQIIDALGQEETVLNPFDKPEATFCLLYDLLRAAEEGRQPETGIEDNLKSHKLMEAAYYSMEHNRVVELADFGN